VYDANQAALRSIFAEWNSSRDYSTRINNILGSGSGPRLNGSNFLASDKVFDDAMVDILAAGAGADWFLVDNDSAVQDILTDAVAADTVTDIDV
jgi:hypothetical protein